MPPVLDQREGFVPSHPFADVARVIQTFPRPNQATNPIVVFELLPDRGLAEDDRETADQRFPRCEHALIQRCHRLSDRT